MLGKILVEIEISTSSYIRKQVLVSIRGNHEAFVGLGVLTTIFSTCETTGDRLFLVQQQNTAATGNAG
jgi:hypothetical protein